MTPTSSLRFSLILALAFIFAPYAVLAQSTLEGTYAAVKDSGKDIETAIEKAVGEMNFIKRPIARSRLKKTNPAYRSVTIAKSDAWIAVTFDARKPLEMPADGSTMKWVNEDGELIDVTARWQSGSLAQTYKSEDGQRLNAFRLDPGGESLTLDVTITSPQLPTPLTYSLAFRRKG